MWFKKKRDVDLRDLHKKGILRVPKEDVEIETDRDGFVDLNSTQTSSQSSSNDNLSSSQTSPGFFNLFDSNSSSSAVPTSENQQGYNKKEIDRKTEELDNKIYKLEQRIDVLERKAGVGSSSSYSW